MASTASTFAFALKDRYSPQKVETLCYSDRPLLAMLTKDTSLSGAVFVQPVIYNGAQGVSGQLGASYLNLARDGTGGNAQGVAFQCTIGEYHGEVRIGDKVIQQSRDNIGAFLQNKTTETDLLYERMSDALTKYLYLNGGQAIGQIASGGISSETATLTSAEDAQNFFIGQYVQGDTVDGTSGTLHAGYSYVTAVDREAGTVTFEDISDITGVAALDYLFNMGDAGVTSTILTGLGGWIASSSSPAALYSVTRTTDPTYLAGVRVATSELTGLGIEERLQRLVTRMTGRVRGPGPDVIMLNPENWQDLAISLQQKGIRPLEDDETSFGFMAIKLVAGGKVVKCYADRFCPEGTAFALKLDTWRLRSMLDLIHPLNGDGLTTRLVDGTTDYSYRLVSYPCFTCSAPGWNGRVTL